MFVLAHVEDNGATADRFAMATSFDPIPCPAATAAVFTDLNVGGQLIPPVVTAGGFVVHDAVPG